MNMLSNGLLLLSMEVCSAFSFLLAIHHSAFILGGADTVSSVISFKVAHSPVTVLLECFGRICILLGHDTLSRSSEESPS